MYIWEVSFRLFCRSFSMNLYENVIIFFFDNFCVCTCVDNFDYLFWLPLFLENLNPFQSNFNVTWIPFFNYLAPSTSLPLVYCNIYWPPIAHSFELSRERFWSGLPCFLCFEFLRAMPCSRIIWARGCFHIGEDVYIVWPFLVFLDFLLHDAIIFQLHVHNFIRKKYPLLKKMQKSFFRFSFFH